MKALSKIIHSEFFQEFRKFISRGNVIDLAVAVVMGTAFKAIVDSIVHDIIMPLIGIILGGVDFKGLSLTLGSAHITYGAFIQALINFFIISFVIFMLIRNLSKLQEKLLGTQQNTTPKIPDTVKLLTEIRDLLKKQS